MADSTRRHQVKDGAVEAVLDAANDRLAGALEHEDAELERPVMLIVGHQRSGSTLVSQYVCAALDVGYPSNITARFWRAPLVGIALQRSLAQQLGSAATTFQSELGTTAGLLDPHEFSYFWNEWFPGETRCRDEHGFYRVVANMERAFDRPMVFKNNFNSLRIGLLARLLPTALFVVVRRDLVDVGCSTLDARRRRYGDDTTWFGVRPPGCEDLEQLSPVQQVAAQLHATEAALAEGLAGLPPARRIEIAYDSFCADPRGLRAQLVALGIEARAGVDTPSSFRKTATAVGHPDAESLRKALAQR
jgi:LPS sulfotransferase NodH